MSFEKCRKKNNRRLFEQLVELIYANADPDPQSGRDCLVRVHGLIAGKLESLAERVPRLLEIVAEEREARSAGSAGEGGSGGGEGGGGGGGDAPRPAPATDSPNATAELHEMFGSRSAPPAVLREVQALIRTAVYGMKTVLWCTQNYAANREREAARLRSSAGSDEERFDLPRYARPDVVGGGTSDEVRSAGSKMTRGETDLVVGFVRHGLVCLRVFGAGDGTSGGRPDRRGDGPAPPKPALNPRHREMIEVYMSTFSVLEADHFRTVLAPELDRFLVEMDADPNCVAMFRHLLHSPVKGMSYTFSEVLMCHLMDRLDQVGERTAVPGTAGGADGRAGGATEPTPRARTLSALFDLVLKTLARLVQNEGAVCRHLQGLVAGCIQHSSAGPAGNRVAEGGGRKGPGPYLVILRTLFRSITGGKHEL